MDQNNEVLQRLTRLETKLDMMLNDPSKDKRITDLEDNQRWLWRAIFGTFITGAITYIIKMM
jgi:hypothetical protein